MPTFQVVVNPAVVSGERGRAQALVVTATNTIERPSTARASVRAEPITAAAWVTPPANVLGRFPGRNATQDFTFSLNVPPTAAAGTYTLRFDVVDTDLPDDHFGSSAPLAVQVAPLPVVVPPNGPPKRWWILIVAAVLVLGAGFTLWKVFGGKRMPDLVTKAYPDALAALDTSRFVITRVDTLADTAAFARGVVIEQSIPAKTKLKSGRNPLRLLVQRSWAVVPRILGLHVDSAAVQLGRDSLVLKIVQDSRAAPHPFPEDGEVRNAVPPPGTLRSRGDTVTAVVLRWRPCVRILTSTCVPQTNAMALARDAAAIRLNLETLRNWRP